VTRFRGGHERSSSKNRHLHSSRDSVYDR
jgi:hypothetical protein